MIKAIPLVGFESKVLFCVKQPLESYQQSTSSRLKAEAVTLNCIQYTVCFTFPYPLRFFSVKKKWIIVQKVQNYIAGDGPKDTVSVLCGHRRGHDELAWLIAVNSSHHWWWFPAAPSLMLLSMTSASSGTELA